MGPVHLIVGLGNPGAEYENTRHNAGFLVLERLATRYRCGWSHERKMQSRLAKVVVMGRNVWLSQPQTFMNLSGDAVGRLVDYYQVGTEQLMIVVDDADLPLGQLRLRPSGSSGGHHGLESIENRLGSRIYARQKIGIGRVSSGEREIRNYVLGKFATDEKRVLDQVLDRAADQLEDWLQRGIQGAMNQFNGAVGAPLPKDSE